MPPRSAIERSTEPKLTAPATVAITEFALPTAGMKPGPIIVAGQRVIFGSTTACANCGVFRVDANSNHRITPSAGAIDEVVRRGWIREGVVMCAPS